MKKISLRVILGNGFAGHIPSRLDEEMKPHFRRRGGVSCRQAEVQEEGSKSRGKKWQVSPAELPKRGPAKPDQPL